MSMTISHDGSRKSIPEFEHVNIARRADSRKTCTGSIAASEPLASN